MLVKIYLLFLAYKCIDADLREAFYEGLAGCEIGFRHPDAFVSNASYPSLLTCVMACQDDVACMAINACPGDSGGFRCQPIATAIDACGNLTADSGCRYFKKLLDSRCENDGTYNITTETCDCPLEEITGDKCEKLFRDCSEAYDAGLTSEVYIRYLKIKPDSYSLPVLAPCYLSFGGELIVESRDRQCNPRLSFNKTWQEFKDGFSTECERWVGLDLLHAITVQGDYNLEVVIWIGGNYAQYLYEHFTIDSETNGYRLDYGNSYSSSSVGNGFEYGGATESIKGQEFATFDKPDASGCALASGAAWWFGDACPSVNLHASYEASPPFPQWPNDIDVLQTVSKLSFRLLRSKVPS